MLENDKNDLPKDVAALHALIGVRDAQLAHLRIELQHRGAMIDKLKLQIAKLRRMQFGRSSEKISAQIEQLELLIEDLESTKPVIAPVPAPASGEREKRKPVRKPLPAHLPREPVIHEAACGCPSCGGALRKIGEDVSEVLDYVPEHWKVIRHIRPKLSCDTCDQIVQAPAPSQPIAKGLAGAGLLAHVIVAKYCDHLPLHRQSAIYARDGVDLDVSTLADWVGQSSALLTPLSERIAAHVFSGTKLHADDTPVPVLAPGLGRTKTGRLWTYVRDDGGAGSKVPPAVVFRYTPDRKGEHPNVHLKDFRGTLQADAYAGFHHLYGERIREAACWAHVRRKFFDLHQAMKSPIAREVLERIGALYAIEDDIKGRPPDYRRNQRQSRAGPLLESLRGFFVDTRRKLSAKSELAGAIHYALSRWGALTRYRDDGALEIDNNTAERALRCVALGRKNYLFCGADTGGERAAILYSLIGTAKLNGLDPEAYLRRLLDCIADYPINKLDDLLPWNLMRPEHRLAA